MIHICGLMQSFLLSTLWRDWSIRLQIDVGSQSCLISIYPCEYPDTKFSDNTSQQSFCSAEAQLHCQWILNNIVHEIHSSLNCSFLFFFFLFFKTSQTSRVSFQSSIAISCKLSLPAWISHHNVRRNQQMACKRCLTLYRLPPVYLSQYPILLDCSSKREITSAILETHATWRSSWSHPCPDDSKINRQLPHASSFICPRSSTQKT